MNPLFAQVQITSGNFNYSQNFNALASSGNGITWTNNSTITGWYATENIYNPDNGSIGVPNKNTLLSLGSSGSTDRALGAALKRRGDDISYGIEFINNSGSTITQLTIGYTGEQWYVSDATNSNTLTFSYQINATDLVSGTWTNVSQLDFSTPNVSGSTTNIDGNNAANRTVKSYALNISLNPAAKIWLKWRDIDDSGNDHLMGIDDFNLTVTGVFPVELTSFSASVNVNDVKLIWETATEVNNYGFEIQRQNFLLNNQNTEWENIGFVKGHGNSNSAKYYYFIDKGISSGGYLYRLKQIDNDGTFDYSNFIEVNLTAPEYFKLEQNYPNPFNPTTTINYSLNKRGNVSLIIYNIQGRVVEDLVNEYKEPGSYSVIFDGNQLASGIYYYKLISDGYQGIKKMMLIK